MPRKIFLPKSLESKLDSLTDENAEISGVLLYQEIGDACIIESFFLTGGDDPGSVKPRQERIEIINEFFRLCPNYKYIEFHTHSKGTIQAYGDQFARSFSREDMGVIKDKLKRDNLVICTFWLLQMRRFFMGLISQF